MKVWLYDRLNGGQMDVNVPMEQFIAEFNLRFKTACNQYVDADMLRANRRYRVIEKPSHPVPSKTSSPILERLMQIVTPETLAKVKSVMIQETIDNMNSQYEEYLKHLGTPKDMASAQLLAHAQGLNDMFAFLEDLI